MSQRASQLSRLHGLYAIADDGFAERPEALLRLVDAFLRGGARVIQLRCKKLGSRELLALARAAVALCKPSEALLFLNDRPDLAALAGADGVHLGQEDLPLAEARKIVGPDVLLGLSTHSEAELDRAISQGANCVGFGPAFATQTKTATAPGSAPLPPPHGIVGVQTIVARAGQVPVIAIGGIDEARAEELAAAGVTCIAAISELCRAPDPLAKTRAFVDAIDRGVRRRAGGRP
jgi:thiamine-phosphate pyrophosphorylase